MADVVQKLKAECERALKETPKEFKPQIGVHIQRSIPRNRRRVHLFGSAIGPLGTVMEWDREKSLVFFDSQEVLNWFEGMGL